MRRWADDSHSSPNGKMYHMSIFDENKTDQIQAVWCTDTRLLVNLVDGRQISVPLWKFPWLSEATPSQRAKVEIGHFGIHWPELNKNIPLDGVVPVETPA